MATYFGELIQDYIHSLVEIFWYAVFMIIHTIFVGTGIVNMVAIFIWKVLLQKGIINLPGLDDEETVSVIIGTGVFSTLMFMIGGVSTIFAGPFALILGVPIAVLSPIIASAIGRAIVALLLLLFGTVEKTGEKKMRFD